MAGKGRIIMEGSCRLICKSHQLIGIYENATRILGLRLMDRQLGIMRVKIKVKKDIIQKEDKRIRDDSFINLLLEEKQSKTRNTR